LKKKENLSETELINGTVKKYFFSGFSLKLVVSLQMLL